VLNINELQNKQTSSYTEIPHIKYLSWKPIQSPTMSWQLNNNF